MGDLRCAAALFVVVLALVMGVEPAHAGFVMEHEAVLPHPATMQPTKTRVRSWHDAGRVERDNPLLERAPAQAAVAR